MTGWLYYLVETKFGHKLDAQIDSSSSYLVLFLTTSILAHILTHIHSSASLPIISPPGCEKSIEGLTFSQTSQRNRIEYRTLVSQTHIKSGPRHSIQYMAQRISSAKDMWVGSTSCPREIQQSPAGKDILQSRLCLPRLIAIPDLQHLIEPWV